MERQVKPYDNSSEFQKQNIAMFYFVEGRVASLKCLKIENKINIEHAAHLIIAQKFGTLATFDIAAAFLWKR